jgi:RNA polymerase sigma-70 factor (ECF subfamily)
VGEPTHAGDADLGDSADAPSPGVPHGESMSQTSHGVIVAGAQGGDSRGLRDQIERLNRAAWALSGSRHEAEDLVQETYARVLARPRRLRCGRELPYLLGALRNVHLNRVRSLQRRPPTVELPADESQVLRSTLAEPHKVAEQHELLAAIAALPDVFREVLVAVDVVGLSYREAGRLLGAPEATVTTRLFRARRRVARSLS